MKTQQTNDEQPGNFNVDKAAIIGGTLWPLFDNDLAITLEDLKDIYDNINVAQRKQRLEVWGEHLHLDSNGATKKLTKKILNDEEFTWWENLFYVRESD